MNPTLYTSLKRLTLNSDWKVYLQYLQEKVDNELRSFVYCDRIEDLKDIQVRVRVLKEIGDGLERDIESYEFDKTKNYEEN